MTVAESLVVAMVFSGGFFCSICPLLYWSIHQMQMQNFYLIQDAGISFRTKAQDLTLAEQRVALKINLFILGDRDNIKRNLPIRGRRSDRQKKFRQSLTTLRAR